MLAIDHELLRQDIAEGPLAALCAPSIEKADDQAVADLFNALTGDGAGTVTLATVSKGDFLLGVAPAALSLPGLSDSLQRKWDRALNLACGADTTVNVGSPTLQALLAVAVQDAVLAQAEVDAITHRVGSRAEILFGVGASVTAADVGACRRLGGDNR